MHINLYKMPPQGHTDAGMYIHETKQEWPESTWQFKVEEMFWEMT